uniref:Leucine-rich repeat protein n=1 Tax=viral metagenome TaxID=1070528 RepID=A0A6C0EDQ2_9ZZZZ
MSTKVVLCGEEYDVNETYLNLHNKGLTKVPPELKLFTNLETLDLSHNEFTELPKEAFSTLEKLTTLDMYCCKLRTIHEDAFLNLKNLKYLTLNYNEIETLHENTFVPLSHLLSLQLAGNSYTTLPENIFSPLANLERLYLYRSNLTTLPLSVTNCTKLKTINYDEHRLYSSLDDRIKVWLTKLHPVL